MSFEDKYNKIFELVSADIALVNQNLINLISVQEPLNSEIRDFLLAPSKRIRSLLMILYLKSLGLTLTEEHYKLLSVIEIVHNASLIHDDIIDESKTRRGKETFNTKLGNKLAVISGDYLLSIAMQKIASLDSVEILNSFAKTFQDMCVGEVKQHYNKFKVTSLEAYIEKSKLKTANLFKTAIECCLILSGIEDNDAIDFAENFGIAFQIRDDLLNIVSCQKSDKPLNNDIECGIYNAPVILASSKDNIMGGIEKTYLLLNNYIDKSIKSIEQIEKNEYKIKLLELLEILRDE